jgi:hypothetical protein
MTNSLNRLQHILNRQQRYIATVHTVNNNGTTLVAHSSGSKEVVIGDSVPSGNVYINDGVIVGAVAALPYSEMDV